MRPYPNPCTTTTPKRAPTDISGNFRIITAIDAAVMTYQMDHNENRIVNQKGGKEKVEKDNKKKN